MSYNVIYVYIYIFTIHTILIYCLWCFCVSIRIYIYSSTYRIRIYTQQTIFVHVFPPSIIYIYIYTCPRIEVHTHDQPHTRNHIIGYIMVICVSLSIYILYIYAVVQNSSKRLNLWTFPSLPNEPPSRFSWQFSRRNLVHIPCHQPWAGLGLLQ